MVGNLFFDGRLVGGRLVRLEIRPQQPCPERVVWPRPALFVVVLIPHRIEGFTVTWWGRVERFACAQVNTGDQDVDVNPAIRFVVLDRRQVDVFRLQPSKRHRLEVLQNRGNLVGGRGLFRRPRDHGAPVSMLERQRVCHRREQHRIAPQYRHPCPLCSSVIV